MSHVGQVRLVQDGRNFQAVKRPVADDVGLDQVGWIDLRVQAMCQLGRRACREVVNIKICWRTIALMVEGHQTLASGNLHGGDVAVGQDGQRDESSLDRVVDVKDRARIGVNRSDVIPADA